MTRSRAIGLTADEGVQDNAAQPRPRTQRMPLGVFRAGRGSSSPRPATCLGSTPIARSSSRTGTPCPCSHATVRTSPGCIRPWRRPAHRLKAKRAIVDGEWPRILPPVRHSRRCTIARSIPSIRSCSTRSICGPWTGKASGGSLRQPTPRTSTVRGRDRLRTASGLPVRGLRVGFHLLLAGLFRVALRHT